MHNRLRLALTTGEPAGIGPDLVLQLASQTHWAEDVIALADIEMLRARARLLNLSVRLRPYTLDQAQEPCKQGELFVLPIPCATPVIPGSLDSRNAAYVLELLKRATLGCQTGEFAAMVTAPLHKGIINEAGVPFTGHTEFLAELTDTPLPVMLLASGNLRVALATTHLPLNKVSETITAPLLRKVLKILDQDLRTKFGIKQPRILVCGLNPHAGEGGYLGMEEIEVLIPTIRQLQQQGLHLTGPLPADTLFTPRNLQQADAVLAMYHDQGLPVLKYAGFGKAVNITLGLPIIRTSVDHGTAIDLAGTGKAETGSLKAAIQLAIGLGRAQH
ncbi:4-hydroxythreonine-4-phosphate dehydrogenase PdxA [uncultured Thiothrix sp.]|uniref:4-hydroxythreonine-4-phosphate dehydrogenase PdxA n=1 Tax=uncultured Thiothrix sp. TaxID=223185 RepID=UPI00262DCEBB|nr:4-hydroxythreonine-4-phosphate dehydrogenase PdxA [uncultured Thiothrix sp.]HMT94058.1 4-hydroxythreonine-4-phosphate dehydrogenase PdxA [Thiolinea sp.]